MNIFEDIFERPEDQLKALRSVFNKTYLGAGNIIEIDLDAEGKIVYKLRATGRVETDLVTAIQQADSDFITQITRLNKDQIKSGSRYAGPASIMKSIGEKQYTKAQRKTLREAGIDLADLDKLEVDVMTMSGKGQTQSMAKRILDLQRSGALDGITIMDDESARLLVFRANGKILSQYQSSLLMRVAGHGLISEEILSKPESYSKIPKRFRTIFSERLISLAGDDLASYLGVQSITSATQELADNFSKNLLITDPQFELLLKSLHSDPLSFRKELKKYHSDPKKIRQLMQYYNSKDTESYFGTYLDELEQIGKKDEFLNIIKNFSKSDEAKNNQGYLSDALETHFKRLKDEGKIDDDIFNIFDKIYKEIEYTFDGSDLLNEKHFNQYVKQLQKKSQSLTKQIELNPDDNNLKIFKADIDSIISQVTHSKYDQITGRGRIKLPSGQFVDMKTAFAIVSGKESLFTGALKDVAGVLSKFGTKKELGIGGDVPMLLLSGFGGGSKDVFSDPVSLAFHPEVFADKETLDTIALRSTQVAEDFKAVLEQNVLPKEIVQRLEEQASRIDVSHLPAEKRAGAIRAREYAQTLLEMHRSGMSPRETPAMANMIFNVFATQVYRVEYDSFGNPKYSVALPETSRFALTTEKDLPRPILGKGFEQMRIQGSSGMVEGKVPTFRAKGKTMYFGTEAMSSIRESLGGFDLDDKGIAKMFRYTTDNGMTRIAFQLTRQPSGVDEKLIARARLDEETVRSLFTSTRGEKYFREALEQLVDEDAGEIYDRFLNIMNNNELNQLYLDPNTSPEDLEKGVLGVYERMQRNGRVQISEFTDKMITKFEKFGFSALQGEEPSYSRAGIYKIFTEKDKQNLAQELMEAIGKAPKTTQLDTLLSNLNNGTITTEEAIDALGRMGDKGRAVIDTAFQIRALKIAEQGSDKLGVYINRSMIVGSTMNQYQDIFNQLDRKEQDFLLSKYSIGLLSQEEAIDLNTQGLTSSRVLDISRTRTKLAAATEYAAMATTGDFSLDTVEQAIEEIFGKKDAAGNLKPLKISQIGDEAIKNLGGLIGAMKALGKGTLGIDKVLMEQRLGKEDVGTLLKSIISGMEEVKDSPDFTVSQDTLDEIQRLRSLTGKSQKEIKEQLIRSFGLGADSEYAALARIEEVAKKEQTMLEALHTAFRSNVHDDILKATTTSDRAEILAKRIVSDNKELIDSVFFITREQRDNMRTEERILFHIDEAKLNEKVLRSISEASKIKGMTLEDLVNAFDKIRSQTKVDVGRFQALNAGAVDDELFNLQLNIQRARVKRSIDYYARLDTGIAEDFIRSLNLTEKTYQSLLDAVQKQLDAMIDPDSAQAQIAKAVLGKGEEIADDAMRGQAQLQANIARSLILEEENKQAYDDLSRVGTVDTALDEDFRYITDDLIRSVDDIEADDIVNKPVYKRLSQKIKDKELSQLFKDPIVRRGSLAIGALVLGSLVYTTAKDRTQDDMTGPPLLPGGSAYEQNYPVRIPEIGSFGGQGYNSGMSYNVSINGSYEDLQRFNEAARGLVNGNSSTTIYEGLPNMTQDPYRRMASEY